VGTVSHSIVRGSKRSLEAFCRPLRILERKFVHAKRWVCCCFLFRKILTSSNLRRKLGTHYSMSRRKATEISHSEIQRSNEGTSRLIFYLIYGLHGRSQWPRSLRHEMSSPVQTQGSWVRIPFQAWIFI
jgi:hypothetical protein